MNDLPASLRRAAADRHALVLVGRFVPARTHGVALPPTAWRSMSAGSRARSHLRSAWLVSRHALGRAPQHVVAVGHTILLIAYHLLHEDDVYRDLGVHYFDERDRQAVERRLVGRLEGLGYKVSLAPAA
jgi:hypothetical protein